MQIKEMKIFTGEVNNKLDTADEMKCSIIFELYRQSKTKSKKRLKKRQNRVSVIYRTL